MAGKEIQLAPMKQLSEAVDRHDDWTGLTDPVTRRRLQNRLHQRAWRRRKAIQSIPAAKVLHHSDWEVQGQLENRQLMSNCDLQPSTNPQLVLLPKKHYVSPYSANPSDTNTHSFASTILKEDQNSHEQRKVIPPLLPYLDSTIPSTSPPTLIFPLPIDQHLITLVQYNVLRATITNMAILNLLSAIPNECSSALSLPRSYDPPSTIPPSLYPTPIQLSVPHDSWIDIFPFGPMKDNLILNQGKYDPDDLCCDISGGLWEGFNNVEIRGLFVWSEPWSEEGWEVTEGFVAKWGWTLKGCTKIIEASNSWREKRGEERLIVEV